MFCKNCGNSIDESKMKCTACGAAAGPLTGGVGFWDLAGGMGTAAPVAEPLPVAEEFLAADEFMTAEEPIAEPEAAPAVRARRKIQLPMPVVLILLAISLVANICLAGVLLSRGGDQEDARPNINRDEDEDPEHTDLNKETEESTDPEDSTGDTTEDNKEESTEGTTEAPADGYIITQPTSENIAAWSGTEKVLFTVTVQGQHFHFIWQWQNPQGEWEDVSIAYFRWEDVLNADGTTTSKLWQTADIQEIEGYYRCKIVDVETGVIVGYTEEVTLTLLTGDDSGIGIGG